GTKPRYKIEGHCVGISQLENPSCRNQPEVQSPELTDWQGHDWQGYNFGYEPEKRKTRAYKEDIGKYSNMTYAVFEDEHYYICHDGRELRHIRTESKEQIGRASCRERV